MEPVKLLPLSPGYQSFVCARAPAHAHTHMHESTRKHDRDRTHARTHTANTHKQVAVQEYSHCNSLHMFRGISSSRLVHAIHTFTLTKVQGLLRSATVPNYAPGPSLYPHPAPPSTPLPKPQLQPQQGLTRPPPHPHPACHPTPTSLTPGPPSPNRSATSSLPVAPFCPQQKTACPTPLNRVAGLWSPRLQRCGSRASWLDRWYC